MPLCSRRDDAHKPHIYEKQKRNIFRERAGQEFAQRARRANHPMQDEQEQAAVQRFLDPAAADRSKPNWLVDRFHYRFRAL
jgi:hypothetical protein